MMTLADWWPLWLTLVALGFGIPETIAILNRTPGDTLSERTRAAFKTTTKTGRAVFIGFWLALAGVWCWFLPHVLS